MKVNYHTHTERCQHAQGNEEDYVKSAIQSGLSILGFSDHAPFPDYDFGYRMLYSELDDYLLAIDSLAKKYSGDITLYKGLEIEYLPKYQSYYENLIYEKKLDYMILGEHFFRDDSGALSYITQAQDTHCYIDYARAIASALKTGYFKMVAHPDIFALNHFSWDKNCDIASDIIIEAAAETDTILEFNANGLRRGIHDYPDGERYMYPHKAFWKKVSGSQVRVMIGSDCHNPAQVWDDYLPLAYEMVKEMGITPTTYSVFPASLHSLQ